MKKIILGALGSLLISQSAMAAHGAFYIGSNTSRSLWHITQSMVMDPTKVINTTLYNQAWGQRQQVFNGGEILAGIKASNGSMFGALETWYNPNSFKVNSTSNDINYNTEISGRWGGRILAGVQHKEMTLYALIGLGQTVKPPFLKPVLKREFSNLLCGYLNVFSLRKQRWC